MITSIAHFVGDAFSYVQFRHKPPDLSTQTSLIVEFNFPHWLHPTFLRGGGREHSEHASTNFKTMCDFVKRHLCDKLQW